MNGNHTDLVQPGGPAFLAERKPACQEHSALTRLLAVEILLAKPEDLQDDGLEACLYVLRDRLREGRYAMRDPVGQVLPADVGTIALPELPTSPSWGRRYTRFFLDSCQGIRPDIAEEAELIVSELVTNAVRFAGNPAHFMRHPEYVGARSILLSLRNFRETLLIEVHDSSSKPPVLSNACSDAENGRGLVLVNALSKEWSYSFPPDGGKIVYCFLEKG